MHLFWEKHELEFIIPAKTSRGEYTKKNHYLLQLKNTGFTAIAEAAPLFDLSIDDENQYEKIIENCKELLITKKNEAQQEILYVTENNPALRFAFFSLFRNAKIGVPNIYYYNNYTKHNTPLPINGLVWMSELDTMQVEAEKKIAEGFTCIKFKIGSHDFDAECRLLESIRKKNNAFNLEIRVDANGAFELDDALPKLKELQRFELHSIEQPIKQNNLDKLEEICAKSKIPIALDEELIGKKPSEFYQLLKKIKPQYIVLKPTLIGGFDWCENWIEMAEKNNCKWWITSALEGNVGLNAIAQFTANYAIQIHHGLGTGNLYKNNFNSNNILIGEKMFFNSKEY